MGGFSDDEDDDDADTMPTTAPGKKATAGKSKKDREAELQAMMDVEDEPKIEHDEEMGMRHHLQHLLQSKKQRRIMLWTNRPRRSPCSRPRP